MCKEVTYLQQIVLESLKLKVKRKKTTLFINVTRSKLGFTTITRNNGSKCIARMRSIVTVY